MCNKSVWDCLQQQAPNALYKGAAAHCVRFPKPASIKSVEPHFKSRVPHPIVTALFIEHKRPRSNFSLPLKTVLKFSC